MRKATFGLHISNRLFHGKPGNINEDYKIYKRKKGRSTYFSDFMDGSL